MQRGTHYIPGTIHNAIINRPIHAKLTLVLKYYKVQQWLYSFYKIEFLIRRPWSSLSSDMYPQIRTSGIKSDGGSYSYVQCNLQHIGFEFQITNPTKKSVHVKLKYFSFLFLSGKKHYDNL